MRVFVTGASGWIGSAVVPELIGAGHQVTGLARSDASAAALTAAGAEVQRGTLDDLDVLRSAAAASDGVIHLAFKHDIAFSGGFEGAADADRRAVETFGDALAGSGRPLVIASGHARAGPGAGGDRAGRARSRRRPSIWPRPADCGRATARADALPGLTAASARPCCGCPPTVHGDGDHGFMASHGRHRPRQGRLRLHRRRVQPLARRAPARRRAPVPAGAGAGPGGLDAARGRRRGRADPRHRRGDRPASRASRWPPSRRGRRPSTSPGWPASSRLDSPASSALTRELLGWQPTQPGLIDDLDKGHYFDPAPASS